MEVLRLEHVSKSFGEVRAVSDLSMSIQAGSMFGLLGPNGAGKTTTIRMIMRIIIQDEGEIFLFDQPAQEKLLDRVGYLPEERGLYRKMKVNEVLEFFGELKNMKRAEARSQSQFWLQRFKMTDVATAKVEELSKGNQQKIQFIATILHRPALVILDEPFSGLDPVNVKLVKDIMLELKQSGCTIIFSTHMMEQVEKLCDSICLINKGQAVLSGDLADVKRRFGRNTIHIEYEGSNGFLNGLDFVKKIDVYGNYVEVTLADPRYAQQLLEAAVQNVKVKRFEIVEPSLNDIFIETVQAA